MSTIFYQNTTDGRCAAAIVKRAIHGGYCLPSNFGYTPTWSKLRFGEEVFLLGIHFTVPAMFDLNQNYKLTYIDHHESSKRILGDAKFHPRSGIMDTSVSTAYSTWTYFFPEEPVPEAVKMISDYTLNNLSDPATLEFWEGMNSVNTKPEQERLWDLLLSDDKESITRIRARGKEIMDYMEQENELIASKMVYKTVWENHTCLMVNYRPSSSRFFNKILDSDPDESVDVLVCYAWIGYRGCWKVTLYTNKIEVDVGILAEMHGGGGQPGVSSFLCDELPWYEVGYTPKFKSKFKPDEYLKNNIVARQCKMMGNRTLFNQAAYYDVIGGLNCGIVNTPEESKNLFDYSDQNLPCLDLGITWCWENRGRFKVVVHPLSGKLDKEGCIKFISNLGYEGGANFIDGNGILFYVDQLPFKKLKKNSATLLTQI